MNPAGATGGSPPAPAGRPLAVLKFGGTSVASSERLLQVAELARAALDRGRALVVVSAVAGVTDILLEACERAAAGEDGAALDRFRARHEAIVGDLEPELGPRLAAALRRELEALGAELARALEGMRLLGDAPPRVRARVAALGERASAALLAALLESRGHAPERLDPRRLLPCAGDPLEATPLVEAARARLAGFAAGGADLAVAPGFFGGDERGEPMLLGRGGSDYSAALFAQATGAHLLEIWTDVAGIYTADPRVVAAARPVAEVSYEEAMELAHFGARVLHPKSVAPARAAGIPVRVRDTGRPDDPGTLVRPAGEPPGRVACGISLLPEVALVSIAGPGMQGVPGVAARAFAALADLGVSVVLITQGSSECVISLGLRAVDAERAVAALARAFAADIAAGRVEEIEAKSELAVVSLVGDGMRHRAGVAGALFGALGAAGVNVIAIAQGGSERSICAVIDAADGAAALVAVHARFFEGAETRAASAAPAGPATVVAAATAAPGAAGPVTAFAPAGIGNLAAGFDLLGAAVEPVAGEPWGDRVEVRAAERDSLSCVGPFAGRLPVDPAANLVSRARAAVERRLGRPLPPLALELTKGLPVASGLGGSAASAVATVVALDAFLGGPLGEQGRLLAAAEAEGEVAGAVHLDNVAPILLGGVRLVACGEQVRELPWPDDLRFVLVVPELELPTRAARAALPREVPLPLAVAHAQNLAALVHALHARDRVLLAGALRDLLAEPYRAPLVPGFTAAKAAALAAGALGCSLSGAGPSLFAVAEPERAAAVGAAVVAAWAAAGVRARATVCRTAPGARVVDRRAPSAAG